MRAILTGSIVALGVVLAQALPALSDEAAIKIKAGPGAEKVQNNCAACHSLDYILMNSPFPDAKMWDAEVTKMIKAFGAPIEDADAKLIIDYLTQNYGR